MFKALKAFVTQSENLCQFEQNLVILLVAVSIFPYAKISNAFLLYLIGSIFYSSALCRRICVKFLFVDIYFIRDIVGNIQYLVKIVFNEKKVKAVSLNSIFLSQNVYHCLNSHFASIRVFVWVNSQIKFIFRSSSGKTKIYRTFFATATEFVLVNLVTHFRQQIVSHIQLNFSCVYFASFQHWPEIAIC